LAANIQQEMRARDRPQAGSSPAPTARTPAAGSQEGRLLSHLIVGVPDYQMGVKDRRLAGPVPHRKGDEVKSEDSKLARKMLAAALILLGVVVIFLGNSLIDQLRGG
jgi:hypothetical protein